MSSRHTVRIPIFLLLVLGGCGGSASDTGNLVPIRHIGLDGSSLIDDGRAALESAGFTVEFRALRDVPADELPSFVREGARGWILYVGREERGRAEAAWNEWLAGRGPAAGNVVSAPAGEGPPSTKLPDLSPDRVQAICSELRKRARLAQRVKRESGDGEEMNRVNADNAAWLEKTVAAAGWIDSGRFGRDAAGQALLLVKYVDDAEFLRTLLPAIEASIRAGAVEGQPYALLYDRLQIMTGGQQRYGTQVVLREGKQIVVRLEDPDRVDARRAELGLGPLADYLKGFGKDVTIER